MALLWQKARREMTVQDRKEAAEDDEGRDEVW